MIVIKSNNATGIMSRSVLDGNGSKENQSTNNSALIQSDNNVSFNGTAAEKSLKLSVDNFTARSQSNEQSSNIRASTTLSKTEDKLDLRTSQVRRSTHFTRTSMKSYTSNMEAKKEKPAGRGLTKSLLNQHEAY